MINETQYTHAHRQTHDKHGKKDRKLGKKKTTKTYSEIPQNGS